MDTLIEQKREMFATNYEWVRCPERGDSALVFACKYGVPFKVDDKWLSPKAEERFGSSKSIQKIVDAAVVYYAVRDSDSCEDTSTRSNSDIQKQNK